MVAKPELVISTTEIPVFFSDFPSDPRPQVTRPAGAGHATRGRGSLAMRRSKTEISLGKPASPRGRTYHWLAIAVKPSKHRNYSGGFLIANCAERKCTARCSQRVAQRRRSDLSFIIMRYIAFSMRFNETTHVVWCPKITSLAGC